jgi:hypothetical protein
VPEIAARQMPQCFIENRGQLDDRVAYHVQGSDRTLYFTSEGVTIALTVHEAKAQERGGEQGWDDEGSEKTISGLPEREEDRSERQCVIKLSFVSANPQPRLEPLNRLGMHVSYFIGNTPRRGVTPMCPRGAVCAIKTSTPALTWRSPAKRDNPRNGASLTQALV